jgi:hypothetical protein
MSASQHASLTLGIDRGKPSTFFAIQNEPIHPNNTLIGTVCCLVDKKIQVLKNILVHPNGR